MLQASRHGSPFRLEIIQHAPAGVCVVRIHKKERFRELCEQAEVQDDPAKLANLADETYEILELEVEDLRKHLPKPVSFAKTLRGHKSCPVTMLQVLSACYSFQTNSGFWRGTARGKTLTDRYPFSTTWFFSRLNSLWAFESEIF
jgi:hypothetical protein